MKLTPPLLLDTLPDDGQPGIATAHVRQRLQSRGMETAWLKSVLRALQRLENDGLARSERQGRHLYWWRRPGAGGMGARRRMGLGEALALRMLDVAARAYQLPWVVRSELRPMMEAARDRLERTPLVDAHRSWEDRVAVLDEGMSRIPPRVDAEVAEVVSMALFKTLRLSLRYLGGKGRLRDRQDARQTLVEPLGWVSRNRLHYLVARKADTGELRHYRIDRIQAAELERPFFYPGDFSLKRHVEDEAAFDYPGLGSKAPVTLKFERPYGLHLLETPVNDTQVVVADTARHITVRFEAWDSERLLWWVRGFGPHVEVLAPAGLRETLRRDAQLAARLYASGKPR